MPTSFIALQCCQCSTMQVKQRKKSSNKWSCVVCNQKQSVRKVFAEAFMAREVRKFVQNFNMSRQLSDQKQSLSEELETFDSPNDEQKRKRNDWTEYVDDQEDYCGKLDKDEDLAEGDDALEPMVVTEMPKVLFKKPKVKDYSSTKNGDGKLFKPLFLSRSDVKRRQNVHSQDEQWTEHEQTSCERASYRYDYAIRAEGSCSHEEPMALHPSERASKWNSFRAQIQDDYSNLADTEKQCLCEPIKGVKDESYAIAGRAVRLNHTTAAKGAVSKWSSFITEEDDGNLGSGGRTDSWAAKGAVSKWSCFITEEDNDNLESRWRRDSWDCVSKRSDYQLESLMNDEKVEDDIHPDFL